MIDELRSTLDSHAAEVVARPDPYGRVLRRRRRDRVRRLTVTVVAVLLVAVPTVWLVGQPAPYTGVAGSPPANLLPLLNSPTRGSLAGNETFLAKLRAHAAVEVDADRGSSGNGPQMPDDPNLIKVLFAGDIGARRVAIVAGLDGWPLRAEFQGEVGDDADEMYHSGSSPLQPVVDTGFASDSGNPARTYLLLGPAGSVYEEAATTFTATGVKRLWTRVPDSAEYVGIADLKGLHDFRVTLDGAVLKETTAGLGEMNRSVSVDPQPVGGRGQPFPQAAQQVAGALANSSRLSAPDVTFRVLWSEELDMPGTAKGKAYVVTVQAVTAEGHGPYLTWAIDTGEGFFREHPTGYGIAGTPETTLIAMRLPHFAPQPGQRLQLIAPPTATRAEVTDAAGITQQVSLVNGVGHLDLPPGKTVTVRAYDAAGTQLATKQFIDLNGFGCHRFDPWSCASPPPSRSPEPTR